MYTLDQQIKDVDKALEMLKSRYYKDYNLYLCNIANKISYDFKSFLRRALLKIEKISPKSYSKTILTDFAKFESSSEYPVWDGNDYDSRLQFLNDLKEDIIENG